MTSFVTLALFSILLVSSCTENTTTPVDSTIQTVTIGAQVWTTKNLDVSTYRNGDTIRFASTPAEWQDASTKGEGAWCYFNNDPKNGEIYGKLYNWYAVHDPRVLAPEGYHIPNGAEWYVLTKNLGGEQIASFKMKSTTFWTNGGNGDNSSGYNGLPSGFCFSNGEFQGIGEISNWWSSGVVVNFDKYRWRYYLYYDNSTTVNLRFNEGFGFSVRCIKD